MQAMNNFGNRGFGGPPQPQRQGGRRGANRGGFRNSRFDQGNNGNQHRSTGNQGNQGGQRPTEQSNASIQQQVKPLMQQQSKPAQQQNKPTQQQSKPQQQQAQQQQTPQQQTQQQQNNLQAQQNKSQPPTQNKLTPPQQQNKPQPQQNQNVAKVDVKQEADKAPTPAGETMIQNGSFGGNKQGTAWNQGSANKGNSNKPPFGQKFGGPGPLRNQRNTNQRGQNHGEGGLKLSGLREEQILANKLKDLTGPILDLPPLDQEEVKFNGRSRLYIGNITNDVSEDAIQQLFSAYGETSELFVNKEKNFGFIKMDYRVNAERAKRDLDGTMKFGRQLRVRFTPHNSAVRVKNLPSFVSNELLYRAFEIFGKIERAYVKVDERGKTVGEGVVEYSRKPAAQSAVRNCSDKCFFLTSSLRPVIVEILEEPDEFDGYPEKNLPKKHPEFLRAREIGPRFSEPGSFEHEYGTRWKQLHDMYRQKEDALKTELAAEEEKLEAQMEFAKYEHETEVLREQLRQREQDRERQKRSWEMAERAADERREAERATLMRHGEELAQRMRLQDDELRRRQQENTLFVQTQRLSAILNREQENMYDGHPSQQPMDGGFRDQYDNGRGYDAGMQNKHGWDAQRQMDDYPNKRRRF